jgi:drug/metabolite transporter (DMT)-like permease
MIPVLFATRRSLPKSLQSWLHFFIFATVGSIIPFSLISYGQLTITSGMAGLLMSLMPLVTLILAHFFLPNDKLNQYKLIGFILGITGVLFILGPSILNSYNTVFGILLVLAAACSYSFNTIITNRLPSYDPLVASTGTFLVGTILCFLIWPQVTSVQFQDIPLIAGSSVIAMGIFQTALAGVIYFYIINNAGATFLSNINYLIPVVAYLLGAFVLAEPILWHDLFALIVIVSGILLSRYRS